jgi:hypothetical protein
MPVGYFAILRISKTYNYYFIVIVIQSGIQEMDEMNKTVRIGYVQFICVDVMELDNVSIEVDYVMENLIVPMVKMNSNVQIRKYDLIGLLKINVTI